MEVKMNKDIREYKSKNSLNLTLVQTFVGVIGVIASGFTIFALRRAIGPGTPVPAFVGTAVMLPFALIGDFGPKIQGLSTRTFVLLWFRFLFLEKRELKFVGNNFIRKEAEMMQQEGSDDGGISEKDTTKTKKRILSFAQKRTENDTSTAALEGRHISKRKKLHKDISV